MQVIGHRGSSPENTLLGIENAILNGADAVEFDVARLACGRIVLIHDSLVDRTTNGTGYVSEHNFSDIHKLDAGNGQAVPGLEEALLTIDRRVPAHIELKDATCAGPVAKTLDTFTGYGWRASDFLVSSFDHHALRDFQEKSPETPVAPIISAKPLDYAQFAINLGTRVVTLNHEFVDGDFVRHARDQGMSTINVFTVNHPSEMLRMARLGVDGIFTDNVPLALQTLKQTDS